MVVDPSELTRARRMLGEGIEILEAPLDEFWMRDIGPTFVTDDERPGVLGAVDWIFSGWGAPPGRSGRSRQASAASSPRPAARNS